MLDRAGTAWIEEGRAAPLLRWLGRELDLDGAPRRVPVAEWVACLSVLAAARSIRGEGWPEILDARIEGLARQTFRFTRPDGTSVFGSGEREPGTAALFRYWAEELADPGLSTVVDWWFPKGLGRHAPPPLPAHSCPDRPLAMLRANWLKQGDFLAIDHRGGGHTCRVELQGGGRVWLGPTWSTGIAGDPSIRSRPSCWVTNSSADLVEWTFRVGEARVVRTAMLLRGRKLALLADQVEGVDGSAAMSVAMPIGIAAEPIPQSRGLTLGKAPGRPSAQILPLGLPAHPHPTDRGTFLAMGTELTLRQTVEGRRGWLPLLVSWEPSRHRKGVRWRSLTVSEKSKTTPPGTASAFLVAWGRDEMLVIYRSHARPTLRSFLGHQTTARFLVGLFSREGDVAPILKVDD